MSVNIPIVLGGGGVGYHRDGTLCGGGRTARVVVLMDGCVFRFFGCFIPHNPEKRHNNCHKILDCLLGEAPRFTLDVFGRTYFYQLNILDLKMQFQSNSRIGLK